MQQPFELYQNEQMKYGFLSASSNNYKLVIKFMHLCFFFHFNRIRGLSQGKKDLPLSPDSSPPLPPELWYRLGIFT